MPAVLFFFNVLILYLNTLVIFVELFSPIIIFIQNHIALVIKREPIELNELIKLWYNILGVKIKLSILMISTQWYIWRIIRRVF